MSELDGNAQTNTFELGKILGVSTEMASTFISEGHVVLSEEKKLTFLRFHDVYQSLRKTAGNNAAKAIA
jgi:hypothetical protein